MSKSKTSNNLLARHMLMAAFTATMVGTAQAQVTTSAIDGTLTDTENEQVIGATIQAVHVNSGSTYRAITDTQGRFHLEGMRAGGPYKITITYIGYKPQVYTGIQLKLGETLELPTQKMQEATQQMEEMVVTAKASWKTAQTGLSAHLTDEDIHRTPSLTHSVGDVLKTLPQTNVSNNGAISFAGSSNRYNCFQIDGAMNNDNFGLTDNGNNGGLSGTQPMSLETIEQINVSIAPFDVRMSGFTGGYINAITKSGTNDFHASVYGYTNNRNLIGSRYTLRNGSSSHSYSKQSTSTYGVTAGGPIVKDKLFFFANYERSKKTVPFAYAVNSPASKANAEVAQQVLSFVNDLAAEQGVDYHGSFLGGDINTESNQMGIKLNWNINDRHKASVRWNYVQGKQLNNTGDATTLNTTDNAYRYQSDTHTLAAELQSRFSNSIGNELRITYVGVRDRRKPDGSPFPMIQVKKVGDATMNLGNERSSMINSLDQDMWTLTNNLSWYLGKHSLTLGTHNELYRFTNMFIQDYYGTYYFNSPEELYACSISRFRFNSTLSATGNPLWKPSFNALQTGWYVQDKYTFNREFSLTYGLRMDIPILLDKPTENADFNQYAARENWNVQTNQSLSSSPMFSPRVGFRWKHQNHLVRGGAGVFNGRIPFVWLSNNFSYTGMTMDNFDEKKNLQNLAFNVSPYDQESNAALLNAKSKTINVLSKDFKFAQALRLDLGYETRFAGIDWSAEAVYSLSLNDVVYRNLVYQTSSETVGSKHPELSFDQRPIMEITSNETAYNSVYMLDNVHKGHRYSLSLSGKKQFDWGLDVAASYTYSHAESANSGVSSMASGNWNDNPTHSDPNHPEMGNSAYNRPHSISASVFYKRSYGNWSTQVGLVYTGSSGSPYSLYYDGDLNEDGSNTNDLMFIPTDAQIDQMKFTPKGNYTAEVQRANMKQWLANDSYLSKHRGEYFDRYADNEDFEHHFDFHLAQQYHFNTGKTAHTLELSFDVMNVGNLLNKRWGHSSISGGAAARYCPVAYNNGEFQFYHDADYDMFSYDDYYSRWRGQIGVRYSF